MSGTEPVPAHDLPTPPPTGEYPGEVFILELKDVGLPKRVISGKLKSVLDGKSKQELRAAAVAYAALHDVRFGYTSGKTQKAWRVLKHLGSLIETKSPHFANTDEVKQLADGLRGEFAVHRSGKAGETLELDLVRVLRSPDGEDVCRAARELLDYLSVERGSGENATLPRELSKIITYMESTALVRGPQTLRLLIGSQHAVRAHSFSTRVVNKLGVPPLTHRADEELEYLGRPASGPGAEFRLPKLERLPGPGDLGYTPPAGYGDWKRRYDENNAHREITRRAVRIFLEQLAEIADTRCRADHRKESVTLRDRLRPVCFVVNRHNNAVDYLDINRPAFGRDDGICGWLKPIRVPLVMTSTEVTRSLPPELFREDLPVISLRARRDGVLEKTASGYFVKRESVGHVWTLHVRHADWTLLLFINWVEPNDTTPYDDRPSPFTGAVRQELIELLRDAQPAARQFGGWLLSSDLNLARPDEPLFESRSELVRRLSQAITSPFNRRGERLRTLARLALSSGEDEEFKTAAVDCEPVVTFIAPVFKNGDAVPPGCREWFDAGEKHWGTRAPGHKDQTLALASESEKVLQRAVDGGAGGDPVRALYLADADAEGGARKFYVSGARARTPGETAADLGLPEESIAVASAVWNAPILISDLERLRSSGSVSERALCGLWRSFEVEAEPDKVTGCELNVPIPGKLFDDEPPEACGVITLYHKTPNIFDAHHGRKIDTVARVYGYLRMAKEDAERREIPDGEPGEKPLVEPGLLVKVLDVLGQPRKRIEAGLASGVETLAETMGACAAYILLRDFRGSHGFRNVGLYCDDTLMNDYMNNYIAREEESDKPTAHDGEPASRAAANPNLLKRAMRGHFVPRRRGFTTTVISTHEPCVLTGEDDIGRTSSCPKLFRALGVHQMLGLVFRSPLEAEPLGCLWLCFRQQNDGQGATQPPASLRSDDADARVAGARQIEGQLRATLDALGALVSLDRLCTHSPGDGTAGTSAG